jgi:hypothetical protein
MKLLIAALLVFGCTSCVDSLTYHGKFADYTIMPHKPLIIIEEK